MLMGATIAYIGPGAGLGLMGALIGVVLAVLSALSFVILWPLRAMFRKANTNNDSTEETAN